MTMLDDGTLTPLEPLIDNIEPLQIVYEAGYGESMVVGIVGGRGSGKSLMLALFGLMYMNNGINVFSTMPIGGTFGSNGDRKEYKAQDLDSPSLWNFDPKFQNSLAIIDELQEYGADSRTSMTIKNQLLNRLAVQIRKRSISMAYSVQSFSWVDTRFRFQTDCLIMARDMCHTEYGREHHYKRGHWCTYEFRDMNGFITGHSWEEFPVPFGTVNIHGKLLWPYFNSFELVGESEMYRKPRIEKTEHLVRPEGVYTIDGDVPEPAPRIGYDMMLDVLNVFKEKGYEVVTSKDLKSFMGEYYNPTQVGKCLSQLGIPMRRTGTHTEYNLEGVKNAAGE